MDVTGARQTARNSTSAYMASPSKPTVLVDSYTMTWVATFITLHCNIQKQKKTNWLKKIHFNTAYTHGDSESLRSKISLISNRDVIFIVERISIFLFHFFHSIFEFTLQSRLREGFWHFLPSIDYSACLISLQVPHPRIPVNEAVNRATRDSSVLANTWWSIL